MHKLEAWAATKYQVRARRVHGYGDRAHLLRFHHAVRPAATSSTSGSLSAIPCQTPINQAKSI
ncbi:hypothetical protein C2845_PM17G11740 [Panicum miliaceum]|uniref:Uncharacterized protein n=1 Tax=Panicum miliaceum TaxID=4540 RepID=A0A3L6Q1M2_PANMI|nr:hypothetical protein C2845_PM17G11740 [Panicum miliaceum]